VAVKSCDSRSLAQNNARMSKPKGIRLFTVAHALLIRSARRLDSEVAMSKFAPRGQQQGEILNGPHNVIPVQTGIQYFYEMGLLSISNI
jgi:hypothetical protein